ncbi:MAG TPA: ATP-binding protein, partial [Pseudonocardiaceae bacterium]
MARTGLRLVGDEILRERTDQQNTIRALLRDAQRGSGAVVLVEGEPGIGKSALLRAASGEAVGFGFSVATGTADQLSQQIPLHALRMALPEPFSGYEVSGSADPFDNTIRWIGRLRAHLEERAAENPVLVCLDDLQWA